MDTPLQVELWHASHATPWRVPREDTTTAVVGLAQLGVALGGVGLLVPLVVSRRNRWARPVRELVVSPWATALIPAGFALAVGGLHGVIDLPTPSTPDEFSNLLLADTLAHGRLANPTPALWEHFEAIAVLLDPVYASKYPPGHGLMLALGQWIWHPWLGVLFEVMLAAGTIALAVRRWLGPRWGLFAGMGFAFHPSIMSFEHYWHGQVNYSWAHSYFGGALATAGGALLLGAIGRRQKTLGWVLAFCAGLGILAHTRPLEGLLVAIPCGLVFLAQSVRTGALREVLQIGVPAAVLLGVSIGGYNAVLTGSPLVFPHRLYAKQYSAAAMFLFQEPREPPAYTNVAIEKFYKRYQRRNFLAAWSVESRRIQTTRLVRYLAWPGAIGLVGLVLVRRRGMWVPVLMIASVSVTGVLMMEWHPHYVSPALPGLFLLAMAGLETLVRRQGRGWLLPVVLGPLLFPLLHAPTVGRRWPEQRQALQELLEAREGKHLVLVETESPFKRWVQNGADLDGADVVWAWWREDNTDILLQYDDRVIWRLQAYKKKPVARVIAIGGEPPDGLAPR